MPHPFYEPSAAMIADPRTRATGLVTMAAYLLFWAGAVAVGLRELDRRFPVGGRVQDRSVAILRERYAGGEIDREQLRTMLAELSGGAR